MIGILFALIGAALGWMRASKLKGDRLDRLQYAGVYAIIGFLIGIGGTLLADWMGWV